MTTSENAIIYLRLSDFRDDDDDMTFTERERELRDFARDELGVPDQAVRVAIENDLNGSGRTRSASAYKTPVKITTATGLITFRTRRPVFAKAMLDLQQGRAGVLIVGDDSRITREERDARDLIDACRVGRASAVTPDDDGQPKWLLKHGGSDTEREAFLDRVNDARKYSAAVAAKVRKGRRRWAGKSYFGGPRPYGYRPDPDAPEHHKTLIIVDEEARVLRDAASAILNHGASLASVARDLRERGVRTARGKAWSAEILRGVLLKPAIAAKAAHNGVLHDTDAWEPILHPDVWEPLVAKLTDPARRTTTANAPKWLGSGIYRCHCGGNVHVTGGRSKTPGYVCNEGSHLRRNAIKVDEHVTDVVCAWLQRDAAHLLKPAPRRNVDAPALRAEVKKLEARKRRQAEMHALGELDDAELRAGSRVIKARLDAIAVQLAESDEADQLAEFRNAPDASMVWAGLSLERRRAILRALPVTITLLPSGRAGSKFNEDSVRILPQTA